MLGFREVDIWSRHHEIHAMRGQITASCLWNACRIMTLGVLLVGLGVIMATIGYCQQQPMSGPAYRPFPGLLNSSQTARPVLGADGITYRHLSYLGSVVMGIGGFVVVASCVMTFEARDSASKIVPARFRPCQQPSRAAPAPLQQTAACQTQPWYLLPPRPACLLSRTASAPCVGLRRPRASAGRRYQPVPGSPRPLRSAAGRWKQRRAARSRSILDALRANSDIVRSIANDVSELRLPGLPSGGQNANCGLAATAGDGEGEAGYESRGVSSHDVVVCVELAADDDDIMSLSDVIRLSSDNTEQSPDSSSGDASPLDTDNSDTCAEMTPPPDEMSSQSDEVASPSDEMAPPSADSSAAPHVWRRDLPLGDLAPEYDRSPEPVCPLGPLTACLPVTANGGQYLVVELGGVSDEPPEGSTGGTNGVPSGAGASSPGPAETLVFRKASKTSGLSLKFLRGATVLSEVPNSSCVSPDVPYGTVSFSDGLGTSDSSSEASDVTVVLAKAASNSCLSIELACSPELPSTCSQSTRAPEGAAVSPEIQENSVASPEALDSVVVSFDPTESATVFCEAEVENRSSEVTDSVSQDEMPGAAGVTGGCTGQLDSCELCEVRVLVTTSPSSPPESAACVMRRPGSWHGSTAIGDQSGSQKHTEAAAT